MILKFRVPLGRATQSPQASAIDSKLSWIVSLYRQFETEKYVLTVENFAERVKSLRNGETETYFLKVVNIPEREQQTKILPSSEWQKLGIEYYATFYCARVRDSTKSDFKT